MQQPCNRLCKYLRYQCVGSARRSVQPWANITILAIKKMCVGRIFRIGAMKAGTAWAQRTYGTTDPGGVWHPVHRRECLTILLRYLRRKWPMQSTDDDLPCIRYTSLLMPAHRLPVFLPIGVCSRCNQLPLCRSGFIGVNETGMPCTKGFVFVQVRLCPVSVL